MRSLIALFALLPFSSAIAEGGSFVDNFDKFDLERWYVSDGWSNGDHQSCIWSKDNIHARNNRVELSLNDKQRGTHAYSCGELQSRAIYGHGTYEVRMKPAALNSGIVSAFFIFTGAPHNNPHSEIDFEFIAKRPRSVDASYHAKTGGGQVLPVDLAFDPRSEYQDYAFHWTPDRLTWYANGKVLRQVVRTDGKDYPAVPGKIYISLWSGTRVLDSWLGPFQYPGVPLVASYERIAYTKLGDDCQFPDSIVCKLGKDVLNGQ